MSLPSITDASESKKKLQCARPRPSSACDALTGAVAELEERQPAVADLLAEHAERVVLAEELLRRVVRILAEPVHHREAAQPAAAAEVARGVVDVDADAADLVGDGRLVGERVPDDRASRSTAPADRSCRGGSGRTCASARPDRAGSARRTARRPRSAPPAVGPASLRLTARKSPVWPGETPTTASPRLTSPYFISMAPPGSSVACAVMTRVESKPRTAHQVTVY